MAVRGGVPERVVSVFVPAASAVHHALSSVDPATRAWADVWPEATVSMTSSLMTSSSAVSSMMTERSSRFLI